MRDLVKVFVAVRNPVPKIRSYVQNGMTWQRIGKVSFGCSANAHKTHTVPSQFIRLSLITVFREAYFYL